MTELDAADYANTLPELSKQVLLGACSDRWARIGTGVDWNQHTFASPNQIAKHLEASNLAECRQGRMGNRFDNLLIRLNERGEFVKQYLLRERSND